MNNFGETVLTSQLIVKFFSSVLVYAFCLAMCENWKIRVFLISTLDTQKTVQCSGWIANIRQIRSGECFRNVSPVCPHASLDVTIASCLADELTSHAQVTDEEVEAMIQQVRI